MNLIDEVFLGFRDIFGAPGEPVVTESIQETYEGDGGIWTVTTESGPLYTKVSKIWSPKPPDADELKAEQLEEFKQDLLDLQTTKGSIESQMKEEARKQNYGLALRMKNDVAEYEERCNVVQLKIDELQKAIDGEAESSSDA